MEIVTQTERKGLDELFLQVIPSPTHSAPPRIVGPVTPFRRLDLNGDNKVGADDLNELTRALSTNIRPQTILHTLDLDRDGTLSREEFRAALEPKRD
ncbi:MAG: EF-hand domain-containing protein [Planctomycetota bacterium]